MTKLLRNLLDGREPVFSLKLRALEAATANHKIDLDLLSNITAGTGRVIKSLGLDPEDTTTRELHSALQSKALQDDKELSRAYGSDVQKMIDRLISKAPLTQIPVVKAARLRAILTKNPPKKVMTALGFRSTESLLKRTPLEQLLLGAFLLESINWHRAFVKSLRSLKPEDITMERPVVVLINPKLLKNGRYAQIVVLQCAGLVGVPKFPMSAGSFLHTATLMTEGLFHLHVRGVLLKLNRFDPDCIRRIAQYTYASPEPIGEIGKVSIPWLSCYCLVSGDKNLQGDIPEGAVEPSDFFWESPSQILPILSQRVDTWTNTTYLGLSDSSGVVSINITDIAQDLYIRVPLDHHALAALRRGINTELLARYLGKFSKKTEIMKKLGLA